MTKSPRYNISKYTVAEDPQILGEDIFHLIIGINKINDFF